jgi:putative aminopeptidase FrvX
MALTFLRIAALVLLAVNAVRAQSLPISTVEEIKAEFQAVPCANDKRLNVVQSLFDRAGATPAIEHYKEVENLVVTLKGESSEKIVIGAHYDKVSHGCGAVDNWTGIVTLVHLYKTLKDVPLKKMLVFVAFGKEEKGLAGSRAMVQAIPKDQISEYCAMINIDSLGMATPQAADNLSSKKLVKFTIDLAKELQIKFAHAFISGADSDATPFIEKKIPAVLIHGLTRDWPSVLHTNSDQSFKVNPASVYLGYRLVLAMIIRLNDSTCEAFR